MADEQTLVGVASDPHVYKENKSQHCVKKWDWNPRKAVDDATSVEGTSSPQFSIIGLTEKRLLTSVDGVHPWGWMEHIPRQNLFATCVQ